jgi:hypothetical protein
MLGVTVYEGMGCTLCSQENILNFFFNLPAARLHAKAMSKDIQLSTNRVLCGLLHCSGMTCLRHDTGACSLRVMHVMYM